MKPAHAHRPSADNGCRKAPKSKPVKEYAPGFFTALILRHRWPPNWKPALDTAEARMLARQAANATNPGFHRGGWGTGTIHLPGTPNYGTPEMMKGKR